MSQSGGSNQGSHRDSGGSSVSAFLSTLIPVFLVSSALFIAFLLLRKKYPRVYAPRTYLGSLPEWQRSPQQSTGFLGWRKEYVQLKDEFVMGHGSLDNFLFIRFFKMLAAICFCGWLTWIVLFPVNATGHAPNATGLDILSFSHINPGPRYYAQVFVSWLFLGMVMLFITRESRFFVRLRQHYYLSPYAKSRISSKTILFVNIPESARSEEHIKKEFQEVRSVWFMNVSEEFGQKVADRDAAAAKLEKGEVKLIKNHTKRQIKLEKKGSATPTSAQSQETRIEVNQKDRATHRLPKLKFLPIGKKVDTVDWARGELHRLIPEVAEGQQKLNSDPSQNQAACFVEFETVQAAHAAMQSCGLKNKLSLTAKEYAPAPENVIWKNITKPFWKVHAFNIACTAFVWFLCIFWSIPVAVIGAISNINYLTNEVPFLSFINDIPSVILGVVTGLLPVLLLSVLMSLVPIICNILAKLFEPTQSSVQMKVQSWYFPFQVIQVFLVTTFASGASSVATQIVQNPAMAPSLLASNLPKASNFYISYFILFGLQTAAMQILNVVPLLFLLILGKILDKTPRKMYNRYVTLAGLGWGSLYAQFTNLGVIALAYSSIAPLLLGFAAIGFTLLYFAYRYNVLFTLGTQVSTRGSSYALALQQLTVGIYLSEICLIGLFAIGVAQTTQSIGPLVLEIVFLIATIAWHVWLNMSLRKLETTLPEHSPALGSHQGQNEDLEKSTNVDESANNDLPTKQHDSNAAPMGAPEQKQGIVARMKGFLYPDTSAMNAARLVSSSRSPAESTYTKEQHDESYVHPARASECPQIWIAKDKYGLSKQERDETIKAVGEGIEVTDEAAWIDEKGNVVWTEDPRTAPIWQEPVAY